MGHILSGQSCASDPRQAVREFHAAVAQADAALVVFFCSSNYDLDAIASEMTQLFGSTPVVGCTTAGEIGPAGYHSGGLSGMSFPAASCKAVAGRLDDLQHFQISAGQAFTQAQLEALEKLAPDAAPDNSFAFLLIDGLSVREEPLARTIQTSLGKIAMFGGSAGDDMKFARTWVFHDGAFHSDAALLILVSTALPFKIFKTQHFVSQPERLVVTEADAAQRIVKEINGLPAAEEYARLIGAEVGELSPARFAASPVVVMVDGTEYVRSIQKANPDGSLTFYSAIDEGLVFRVARGEDLLANLQQTYDALTAAIGEPQLVIACDCILRNLEVSQRELKEQVGDIFRRYRTVGFSTYGEQFGGVHVNQTLTGIAIGQPPEAAHG
jgi:hypothetical protein